jgi:hypothetical protein
MEDLPDGLERLEARVESLERRVRALEHTAEALNSETALPQNVMAAIESGEVSAQTTAGAFSVFGKAMLGIAGAYLLRALAELNVLPRAAVATVAIAYAMAWLILASRSKGGGWLASTIYACTSALILAPMLWELMLRFNVLTAPVASAVIAGFAVAASALAWRRELAPVLWVANLTAATLALSLSIASHQMLPFIGVLLAMVLTAEYAALRGRESGVRILTSFAADVAIWALIFIYSSPESARMSYPHQGAAALIAPGIILFFLFGASVIYRTIVAGNRITLFEILQTTAAFALAACGLFYLGPPASVIAFGIVCLALAGAGYVAILLRLKDTEDRRNLWVFAGWSGALLLAGSLTCLPEKAQSTWLGTWAVAASWTGVRMLRAQLQLHGLVFLLVAAAASGLLNWIAGELASSAPGRPAMTAYLIMICAIACYGGVARARGARARGARNRDEEWKRQALAIALAVLAAGTATALLVQTLTSVVALKLAPGAHHLAVIRTLTICVAAVGLVFSGARWGRAELTKIGYAALVLLVLKLAVEDLRHGQLAYIAASIFLFAIALILVPRAARMGTRFHQVRLVKDQSVSPVSR